MTTGKTIALTGWTFVGKVLSLLFNMLSRLVIAFLPRSKHILLTGAVTSPRFMGKKYLFPPLQVECWSHRKRAYGKLCLHTCSYTWKVSSATVNALAITFCTPFTCNIHSYIAKRCPMTILEPSSRSRISLSRSGPGVDEMLQVWFIKYRSSSTVSLGLRNYKPKLIYLPPSIHPICIKWTSLGELLQAHQVKKRRNWRHTAVTGP